MMLFYLLLLLIPVSFADGNCPGWCGDPVEEIKLWTDNSHIWRCELPSVMALPCADDAYISCRRLDDLGGDLYLMLFADSPDDIGIDPDFLAKGRIDTLRTVLQCKDGKWTLPDSTIQMTHILCDQYIINKTKAEESPFKPLPFKPEVDTSAVGTVTEKDESNEEESTSMPLSTSTNKITRKNPESLETSAHNATGSTSAEIPRNITATNFMAIESTKSSTEIPETTGLSSPTSSSSSADIVNSKVPQSTSTIFLNSTTTSQSQKPEFESFSGVTLKHTTLAVTTTSMPTSTLSSIKPLFQPTSTIRTTTQVTRETTVEENKLKISNMSTTMTSASKSVKRSPTIIRQATSAASPNPRPLEEAPVPKIAQKPTALPITSTSIHGFTTVGSASATNMLAPMPKSTATITMKTMDTSVALGLKTSSTANSATKSEEVLTTTMSGTAFYSSTTLLEEQQFPEITTPKPTNASNATTSILVLLVETVLPTTTSNISTSTTTTEVTATSPQQIVSVRVPTKATESISTSATKLSETTNPSTIAFDSAIILLPPTTTEQLPTSQQSPEQISPADTQILLQPDPYDGVIEPVVIAKKLATPLRQSRFGDLRKERLRFRKKVVPAAGISRKTRPRKATKTRKNLGRSQKRRKQVRIPGTETKSKRRQHVERKTL